MLDSFERVWRQVLLHCPVVSPFLARVWVNNAFRRISERRRWSWLVKEGQFLSNLVVTAGSVTVTRESDAVVGVGTAFTTAMQGRQFRVGTQEPIVTISAVADGLNLTLDRVWGGPTASGAGYEIYNAYFTAPSDFHSFISVWDPRLNWQLTTEMVAEELNVIDSQRADSGNAYAVVAHSYDSVSSPPLPRYEIWPHAKDDHVWPFLYEARLEDLEDVGASLPRYIRGDVLLEMALDECARWPGPSTAQKNPYYSLTQASAHQGRALDLVMEMERQDDEVYNVDVRYQTAVGLSFAAFPLGDASWLQSHALVLPLVFTLGACIECFLVVVN